MKKRPVYCVELDKWFDSIAEASRETGESVDKIRYNITWLPDTDGYTWRDESYYKDYFDFLVEKSLYEEGLLDY
jgi:hypothetical protein